MYERAMLSVKKKAILSPPPAERNWMKRSADEPAGDAHALSGVAGTEWECCVCGPGFTLPSLGSDFTCSAPAAQHHRAARLTNGRVPRQSHRWGEQEIQLGVRPLRVFAFSSGKKIHSHYVTTCALVFHSSVNGHLAEVPVDCFCWLGNGDLIK